MSHSEKNANKNYPMPWRATTRLPYESDPKQQLQRIRINPDMPNGGEDLVAYDASSGLVDTRYHGTDKNFQFTSVRDVLYEGLRGLETYLGREAARYIQYSSSLYHAAKDSRRDTENRYAETLKALPALEKAFAAAEVAANSLREAELKDRISIVQDLGNWIAADSPDIWVQTDTYTIPEKGRHLAACGLLKLTDLYVDEPQRPNEATLASHWGHIIWEGTGLDGVSETYSIAGVKTIYLPAGPLEQMPMQFAYPRGDFL